jgi:1-aminocyclopropane-1-carboxylate deaminase/D-cysteine desulfhydrase-like pyridoxal-dependent ACC family enzyme
MNLDAPSLPELLKLHPRAHLIQTPAIIHKLPRLSARVGCDLYILRDDLTGFGLGGNKTRKLDFLVGDALARSADTLVTIKATSFSRNAAAAASAHGLALHVVLPGGEAEQNPLSQAFFAQFGARLHYAPKDPENALQEAYEDLVKSLKAKGKAVYVLHPGGSDTIGALAYVHAFQQILDYSRTTGVQFTDIVLSTGSTGTQAGLVVGQGHTGYPARITGVIASLTAEVQTLRIGALVSATAGMLGTKWDERRIRVDDRFIGPGYAIPSEEGRQAARLFATLEGVLLDDVYTGKAAAALLHYAEKGELAGGKALFIHTGGNAGLFY